MANDVTQKRGMRDVEAGWKPSWLWRVKRKKKREEEGREEALYVPLDGDGIDKVNKMDVVMLSCWRLH
jgi:hypothetical protein